MIAPARTPCSAGVAAHRGCETVDVGVAADEPGVVRCRVLVSGRVQGVYYRDSCRREAQRLGVRGWVRNDEAGDVEIAIEGPREAVGELVAWCRHGPPRAIVTGVRVIDERPIGESGFHIAW